MSRLIDITTLVAALGAGAMGGVFFAFSTFVMRGLDLLPPAQAVAAMQGINTAAINRWFMGVLFGTAVLGVAIGVWALMHWSEPGAGFRCLACVVFLLGTIVVTIVCNVPRNEALEVLRPDSPEIAGAWGRFLQEWTMWNHVRTISSIAAAALFIHSLLTGGDPT